MNEDIISEIYRSNQSFSYGNYLEYKKIQDSYWKRFIGEFNRLVDRNNEEYKEEQKAINKLKELIESEMFQYIFENDKYCEKINSIISKETLVVGQSHSKLLNMYHELAALCNNYKVEYEAFVEDIAKKTKIDYCRVDSDTRFVFENIFAENVCKESFFNTLSNNGLI